MNDTEFNTDAISKRIREEAIRRRESLLGSKLDQAKLQQEQIEELAVRLEESEADRAARFDQIMELTKLLEESEADRAARFDQITELTKLLTESEADRAARLDVIHSLEEKITHLQTVLDNCEGVWRALKETFAVRLARRIGLVKIDDFVKSLKSRDNGTAS
jgi:uncharacterized protein (DUF3084 family)